MTTDEKPSVWRVFRLLDVADPGHWIEVGEIRVENNWREPYPDEIGERFGEGQYLLIETDDSYSTRVREKLIVAKKYYEEIKETADVEAVTT